MNWLNEIETPCQQSNDEPTIPCQTEEPGDNLCEVQPSQFGAHQHDTGSGSSITDITNVGDVHNFTEHEGEAQFLLAFLLILLNPTCLTLMIMILLLIKSLCSQSRFMMKVMI